MLRFLLLFFAASFCLTAAAGEPVHAKPRANLTILVDDNLILPVSRIARAYAKASDTPLTIAVLNPEDVHAQIGQGLEAHMMITANTSLISELAESGLTDATSNRPVARTQLALVSSNLLDQREQLTKHISFAAILYATPDVPIYIQADTTRGGERAAALLKGYEFSDMLSKRASVAPTRDSLLQTLRATPAFGLMLANNAFNQPDITLLSVLPEHISPPVAYRRVILASESMPQTREFGDSLLSPEAQRIFLSFGFQPPSAK